MSHIPLLVGSLCYMLQFTAISAMPASPFPFTVTNFDGKPATLFIRGSEQMHTLEDPEGYTVVDTIDFATGAQKFVYAALGAQGQLTETPFTVGAVNPASVGLSPKITPTLTSAIGAEDAHQGGFSVGGTGNPFLGGFTGLGIHRRREAEDGKQRERRIVNAGTYTNLVVMVRWSDCQLGVRNGSTPGLPNIADLNTLFNGRTNSVKDVYLANSYGRVVVNSVFTDWITVDATEAQAAQNASGLSCCSLQDALTQALQKADAFTDFSLFDANKDGTIDMITFVHSGYAAEWGGANYKQRIWSHKWSLATTFVSKENVAVSAYHISPAMWGTAGTSLGHIAVIAHELGHFIGGLPDLYDTDLNGSGLGSFSLMANSWGFDNTQNNPPLMDAWSRSRLGWCDPTDITASGTYTARAMAVACNSYKITQGYPAGEYLLIENRQPLSYDRAMPGGGIAIYHIDENALSYSEQGWPGQTGWPYNGNHYHVALVQADGLWQLESTSQRGDIGDLYAVGRTTVLSPFTNPNTNMYQDGSAFASTGITINVTSAPGEYMSFTVSMPGPAVGISSSTPTSSSSSVTSTLVVPTPTVTISTTKVSSSTTSSVLLTSTSATTATTTLARPTPTATSTTSTGTTKVSSTSSGVARSTSANVASTTSTSKPTSTSTPAPTATAVPTPMLISSVSFKQVRVGSTTNFQGSATVKVVTKAGKSVPGAVVTGRFVRANTNPAVYDDQSSTTRTATGTMFGVGSLLSKTFGTQTAAKLWFCVTGVAKEGFAYAPALNAITCINAATTASATTALLYKS